MRRTIIAACLLALSNLGQAQTGLQQPVTETVVVAVGSAWPGECGPGVVDNRSVVSRQNTYHAIGFVSGTGSWSAALNYSDVSCVGPWTTFGSASVITQASNPAIGYGNGNHSFIQIVITGNVLVTYTALKTPFLSTSVGSVSFPISIGQGGTGATTSAGALANLLQGNAQGTYTNKVQMAGTNSNVSGAALCDDSSGNATTSGCAALLPSGSQTQYLQITPSTGNTATLRFNGLPEVSVSDYNFTPQTPGGSLTAGSSVITLSPGPLGVLGSASNYYVRISGGTGTAESSLVTGGTCNGTGLQSSCTLIVTVASCGGGTCHSGAWTIGPVFGGINEAAQANPSGATLKIPPPPTQISAYAPWVVSSAPYRLVGASDQFVSIVRDATFTSSHMIEVTQSGSIMLQNIGISSANADSHPYAPIACVNGGVLAAESVTVSGASYIGVLSDSCNTTYLRFYAYQNGNPAGNLANSGVKLDCNFGPAENTVLISDSGIAMFNASPGTNGMDVVCVDGLQMSNVGISALRDIIFEPSGTKYVANVSSVNAELDFLPGTIIGIAFAGTSSDAYYDIDFSGGWVNCELESPSIGVDLGTTFGTTNVTGVSFNGLNVTRCVSAAYAFGSLTTTTATLPIVINGGIAGGGGTGAGSGILVDDVVNGSTLHGLSVSGTAVNNSQFGINATTPLDASIITPLCGNGSPVTLGANFTGILLGKCLSDASATVASAATLNFPPNPNVVVTGTNGVTAVGRLWAGRAGTLITPSGAVAFTSGATIGNSCTTTQNKLYNWYDDGTHFWMSGPGC